ncbi:MAG: hypothetical protein GF332_04790 [Candidatus Moranbacteria bacterium]|nr:hypothetical protein [Candidatus Moranbacteria bacterium]
MNAKKYLQKIKNQYPDILDYAPESINKNIFFYNYLFTSDKNLLISSLIYNPFGQTENLNQKKNSFNREVYFIIKNLNQLQDSKSKFLKHFHEYKPVINLFLAGFKIILDKKLTKAQRYGFLSKPKLNYIMELVEKNDISGIRESLEDRIFSFLYPKLFANYSGLLRYSHKNFRDFDRNIKQKLSQTLSENGINAKIYSRFKSINSVHKKITRKNILYSQVLDIIGLRVLVEKKSECYRVMELIISNWTVIHSKIKDFIAVPKDNGYQSIHLTILYNNHPIEIQIRTYQMHWIAQFGLASHFIYKK